MSCRKRGADGDNQTDVDDDDDNGGIAKQSKKARTVRPGPEKTTQKSLFLSVGQQERLKSLRTRVEKAERDKDDAKRKLDDAQAALAARKADVAASKEDIQRAQNSVDIARSAWQSTVAAHTAAMAAETTAFNATRGGGQGAREVSFSFEPSVLARLKRPLKEWKAGETFDLAGFEKAVGVPCHDVLFLRAQGLDLLRDWESGTPHMAVYGSPGIGKSSLLQLAALRALVLGNPVLLHVRDKEKLIQIVDDATLRVERLADISDLGCDGRADQSNVVVCFDSRKGYDETLGLVVRNKQTIIVHSPSGNLNNTRKSYAKTRLYTPPILDELVAVGALGDVDENAVKHRVERFGPIFRYVMDDAEAEKWIQAGIEVMVPRGPDRLLDFYNVRPELHSITLMLPKPDGSGVMHSFASDFSADEVLRRMAQKDAFGLLRLANTVDIHGSLCGQVFENRMLDTLGRVAKITFITGGGNKDLQVAGDGVTLCKADGALTLPAGNVLQQRVLYRPPHSNNASWDALVVESDQVAYLLQMTVASAHAVKQHGLAAGKSLLAKAGFRGEVRLVFLLPPHAFSAFLVPQAILNVDGKAVAASTAKEWPQEKWCVEKVGDGVFWPPQQKE